MPGCPHTNLRRLAWADRAGVVRPLQVPAAMYFDPSISPDGTRAVVVVAGDLWVSDFRRTTFTRLTINGTNGTPIPSNASLG